MSKTYTVRIWRTDQNSVHSGAWCPKILWPKCWLKIKCLKFECFWRKSGNFNFFVPCPIFISLYPSFFLFLLDKKKCINRIIQTEKKIISPHRVHAITFLYSTHNIFMTSVIRDKPSHKSYITIHGYLNIRFFCNYCIVYVLLAIIV